MPSHTITVNGTASDLNYFCIHHGYSVDGGETQLEFMDRKIKEFCITSAKYGKSTELSELNQIIVDSYSTSF